MNRPTSPKSAKNPLSPWRNASYALVIMMSACVLEPTEQSSTTTHALSKEATPTKWRIRNASAQNHTGEWIFRKMAFCADEACTQQLTGGTAIDSESSVYSIPANAFDGDYNTLWKGFNAGVVGAEWIGMDFGASTDVKGLYLRTDNVVYSVDAIYIEYYDDETAEWVIADLIDDVPAFTDVTYAVEVHNTLPVSWRVRNASVQNNTGEWVLREMDFCADEACTQPLTDGTPIDSESSVYAVPENAFDNDVGTLWKGFNAGVVGEEWIGMDFGVGTDVKGIYLRTDNVVYHVDEIYVEYYDLITAQWITADVLHDVPAFTDVTYGVKVRPAPIAWRLRNADVNNGNWNLREIDFCADAACTEPLSGGTAIDSESSGYAVPSRAFDDDLGTFWKGFHSYVEGWEWIGMEFDTVTDVRGLYMRTDNIVYHIDAVFVEYFDLVSREWVLADVIHNIPDFSDVNYSIDLASSYWSFDESSGTTAANQIAYGDSATLQAGATFTSDTASIGYTNPNALGLDGSNAHATIADSDAIDFANDQDFTVSVWIKADPVQPDTFHYTNCVVEKWSGGRVGYPFVIRYHNQNSVYNGKVFAARYDGSNNPAVMSSVTLNDGAFHHVVFVKRGTNLYLYIDGVLDGQGVDTTTGTTTNSSALNLGRRGNDRMYFKGAIDDLRIYDYGLSDAAVGTLSPAP